MPRIDQPDPYTEATTGTDCADLPAIVLPGPQTVVPLRRESVVVVKPGQDRPSLEPYAQLIMPRA